MSHLANRCSTSLDNFNSRSVLRAKGKRIFYDDARVDVSVTFTYVHASHTRRIKLTANGMPVSFLIIRWNEIRLLVTIS